MGFRRSPDRNAAAEAWQRFLANNAGLVAASGLPAAATETIQSWDDLLVHGHAAADPGRFSVGQLTPEQYRSLVELIHNYFSFGYEFYSPHALSAEDQEALRARFGPG
jgi:hypothetical protein